MDEQFLQMRSLLIDDYRKFASDFERDKVDFSGQAPFSTDFMGQYLDHLAQLLSSGAWEKRLEAVRSWQATLLREEEITKARIARLAGRPHKAAETAEA